LEPGFEYDGVSFVDRHQYSGGYNDFVLDDLTFQAVTSAVPEPSTWAMIIIGFLCLGFMANRCQNLSAGFA
jgi:hypothetical protein